MGKLKESSDHYEDIHQKAEKLEALINLSTDLHEQERRKPLPFNDFLHLASTKPDHVFRDIFQLFHDMIHYYVPEGHDEYKHSTETIGFRHFDTSKLFVEDCDAPFFADRLLANRMMNWVERFKQGIQQNHIYLFEGPPGSGKSTFLNILLSKLEDYTRKPEGTLYETHWSLDIEKLGGIKGAEQQISRISESIDSDELEKKFHEQSKKHDLYPFKYLDFCCPRHDHPILQIPKSYRGKFLDELIPDKEFKTKLFNDKEYSWILKDTPCDICKSLYDSMLEIIGNPLEVYGMLHSRRALFNRQLGEGVTVFNPGDPLISSPINNQTIEKNINEVLKSDEIKFTYSYLAKTNNGIHALMDIKEKNIERLMSLHSIISDGFHKVGLVEERIKTLFIGLINPEDKKHYENYKSFKDRVINVNIPYVLDFKTEVAIYLNRFGENVSKKFLPRILENFAKIIIATRMEKDSPIIKKWITVPTKYNKYCDTNLYLLKMSLYTGIIPNWLTDEDLKKFDRSMRKEVLGYSENEGKKGFSGRQSLNVFSDFISKNNGSDELITMDKVISYFSNKKRFPDIELPEDFISSVERLYDYNVLQEIKESIYYFNEDQISREILNYLFAINFEPNCTETCPYTGDEIEIDDDYFKNFEALFVGTTSTIATRLNFRKDVQKTYISKTLSQEINSEGIAIKETNQFQELYRKYTNKLKENALLPYKDNASFRRAIKDYNTDDFKTYDDKIKKAVNFLIKNLTDKFNYTLEGARQVAIYVLDKDILEKY